MSITPWAELPEVMTLEETAEQMRLHWKTLLRHIAAGMPGVPRRAWDRPTGSGSQT